MIAGYSYGLSALKTFAGSFTCSPPPQSRSPPPCQPVQLVDQRVDLPVRGLDLPPQRRLLVRRVGLGELFMQSEHSLHQGDHAIMADDLGGVGLNESVIASS